MVTTTVCFLLSTIFGCHLVCFLIAGEWGALIIFVPYYGIDGLLCLK